MDSTYQVLKNNFGLNQAGDYVWSRQWQDVTDQYGNVGRIYQIRIGKWNGQPGVVEYNLTDPNSLHTYYAFSGPLVVNNGTVFTVLSPINANANQLHHTYGEPTCFTRGVLIATEAGLIAIEDLRLGDMVLTRDHGAKPVMWIGVQRLDAALLAQMPDLRPIRIRAGALGGGLPRRDLCVSPQHRMVLRNAIVNRMFGEAEVMVAAKHLLDQDGVDIAADDEGVEYYHFLLDQHEIVFAEGAETETLYTGPEALKSLNPAQRREILILFPELASLDHAALPQSALSFAPGRRARHLVQRAARNGQPLLT